MTSPEPTPDTATLADRIEDALADALPVLTDPENAGLTVLHYGTEPGDMEWGAAATLAARLMDAIRPLITDALADNHATAMAAIDAELATQAATRTTETQEQPA